ncbi:carboxypeptidase M32 [Brevibacillus ruminantium]|uniref:Metal-dependent carboxypeptidase n=1 Tax=Brevibacillus ruminantium TaxID=2950604 RepID=A0ABY4W9A2_9BACL|nr:carboxypeptidase M32 [Brevibacillus ruminantium]USG63748.1 carboxypeptidase M32 [Brevibacillus ruminantium]
MSANENRAASFRQYVKKMVSYNQALAVLHWDKNTQAPKKGMDARSEIIGVLAGEQFKLATSPEMEEHLEALSEASVLDSLDEVTRATVLDCKKDFERNKKIPADRYQEFVVLTSQAETVWEEARAKNDFALFRPYLERIVNFQLEFIGYWGDDGKNKYNTLLDLYEPGMTVDQLDPIFATLREKTVKLVAAIADSPNKPDTSFLHKHFPEAEQEAFSRVILEKIGYDFQAGRMDRSVHPFCTSFNPGDVRITTRFDPNDFNSALFSCIHEAGHAMYEQNIDQRLLGTTLCDGTSMGIHESQSRYWENMIGRSLPFWTHFYPELQKAFPAQFAGVSVEQFYRAINHSAPSFIRTEADELTYNLHVMIRYEIEKGLINQTIEVGDLPAIWNTKMKEYLGIVPENDKIGVLQDIHWAGGSFGYFPTYSLGNVYAAQFTHVMQQQISGYEDLIASGQFEPIRHWLKENIHQYGKMKSPGEIVKAITGEGTNAEYLMNYLEKKFSEIYNL